jgi:hypothetical protein
VIDPDLNKYVKIRRKGGLGVWHDQETDGQRAAPAGKTA